MTYDGRLLEVEVLGRGTSATEAVAVGGVEVGVQDLTEFSDEGGRCEIDGVQYDYSGIVEADDGTEGGTLVLADPLTVAVAEADPVLVVVGDQAASDAWAVIDLGSPRQNVPDDGAQGTDPAAIDGPDVGDVIRVPLSFSQRLVYREGVYEPPVPVQVADDLTAVIDVPGVVPNVSWGAIDPATVPPLGGGGGSDGEVPASSPDPTLVPGIGALFVKWEPVANADPVTYDVHVVAGSADFAIDATNLVGSVTGTLLAVRALADGTPLSPDDTYAVKILARDVDGPAAAPGAFATNSPAKITSPDIATDAITADMLTANDALFEALQAQTITGIEIDGVTMTGATLRTDDTDDRVEIGKLFQNGTISQVAFFKPGMGNRPAAIYAYDSPGGIQIDSGSVDTNPRVEDGYKDATVQVSAGGDPADGYNNWLSSATVQADLVSLLSDNQLSLELWDVESSPQSILARIQMDPSGITLSGPVTINDTPQPLVQFGTVTLPAGSEAPYFDLTFAKPYASPPAVMASVENTFANATANNITATGCRIQSRRFDNAVQTAANTATWIAVGTPA